MEPCRRSAEAPFASTVPETVATSAPTRTTTSAQMRHAMLNDRRGRASNGWPLGGKKCRDAREVVHDRRGRQRGDEAASVSFRTNPRVEHDEDAAVAAVTDEAAEPLLQCKDGERHLVIAERVAAAGADRFDARRGDRIGRRGERQLVDDDAAERFTDDVD